MGNNTKFYIDGAWVSPVTPRLFDVINPATEELAGQISLGSSTDVDRAVAAARRAFTTYSPPNVPPERVALLRRAFDAMAADPEFRDDARKRGLDVTPASGEVLTAIVERTIATPAEALVTLKTILGIQ